MKQETVDKLFTKVVDMNKSARMLAGLTALRKQAAVIAKKQAVYDIANGVMCKKADQTKQAGPKGELASTLVQNFLYPLIGPTGVGLGASAGSMDTPATEEAEKEWDAHPGKAWLPGVSAYRLNRRHRRQLVDDKGNSPHAIAQGFGPITSTLAAMLAGGAAGGALGAGVGGTFGVDDSHAKGALLGGGVGALAGTGALGGIALLANLLGGPIAAAMTKRRTAEEQRAYNNSSTLKEYLIPGVAPYNAWKTTGRVFGAADERKANTKDTDKKEDKKEEKS